MISDGHMPQTNCYFSMFSIQDTWEPKEESLDKYAYATNKIIEWYIPVFNYQSSQSHKTKTI